VNLSLALLTSLFLVFLISQASYFFGGMQHVLGTPHLTLAQYARRGFFELVVVVLLVLPLLLSFDWFLLGRSPKVRLHFQILSGTLVAQVLLIIGSAVYKMMLYRAVFGLTELRYFTTAFMLMLALVFAWLCVTVLMGRRSRFVGGAMAIGIVSAFLLQASNPDARIARANIAGLLNGNSQDVQYVARLGGDGVAELVAALPQLPQNLRARAIETLNARKERFMTSDWREWNLGRSRAARALAGELAPQQ
jgi:hypothetical protein